MTHTPDNPFPWEIPQDILSEKLTLPRKIKLQKISSEQGQHSQKNPPGHISVNNYRHWHGRLFIFAVAL